MSRRRYRGSVIGVYIRPTSTTASGVYDLDTAILNTGLARWPAATAGTYRIPGLVFFALGQQYQAAGNNYGAYTLMSYYSATGTLVSESNPAGVSTRAYPAAAGYGFDKAVVHGGRYGGSNSANRFNLVSNTGILSADDTTGTTYAVEYHSAATYGFKNAVFFWGYQVSSLTGYYTKAIWKMNDTATWTNASVSATYWHGGSTTVGYSNGSALSLSSLYPSATSGLTNPSQGLDMINDLGTLTTEQVQASTHAVWTGTRYGDGTAVMFAFSSGAKYKCYVTNTGVIGADQAITITDWSQPSSTALPNGSAIVAYGQYNSSNTIRPSLIITNTGVFGTESTVTENTNQSRCAAGYS
jgi:hypothetical protein